MKKQLLFGLFGALSLAIGCWTLFVANTSGPASDASGSPISSFGTQACRGCHSTGGSFNPNSGINLTGLPATYYPGTTYTLTLSLNNATSKNGFQGIGLTSSNAQAGSFTAGTGSKIQTIGGRGFIEHNSGSATGVWTFDWTAPSTNVGGVTFYFAGNASNNNFSTSGDNIYTFSMAITGINPMNLGINTTDATCFGVCDGSATTNVTGGAGAPYTFAWSNGSTSIGSVTGLCAGTYTLTVTDQAGNEEVQNFTVSEPTFITPNAVTTDPTCAQGGGSISITASGGTGPFTYQWAGSGVMGNTNPSISGLAAGTYTVTITDINGCTTDTTITLIDSGSGLSATFNTIPATCAQADGEATVSVSGGMMPYTYQWSSGGTNAQETGLAAGMYTVTVTDVNSCTDQFMVNVTNAGGPTLSINQNQSVTCFGGSDGSVALSVSSGTAPYTFTWDPAASTDSVGSNLQAGTYDVTVLDATGCQDVISVTVTEPTPFTIGITANDDQNGTCTGDFNISVSGNNTGAGIIVDWGPPISGQGTNFTGLCSGTYTGTVTDASGCDTVISVTIENVITGINEQELSDALLIFPNPATDQVSLRWTGEAVDQVHVRVFSAIGQLVWQNDAGLRWASESVTTIPVAGWDAGLYWVDVQTEDWRTQRTLVVR